ncbi:MAG: O-antigen ligase family protein [Kouleothrix sp.]|nr:O-antigen ligase family protein [Kouleothrix sp.]
MTRLAWRDTRLSIFNAQGLLLALMGLGLALFYWGGALAPALLGLAIFGALALLRPDLGLLFVPLAAPLYLIPAAIGGIRAEPFLLPLHEAALLVVGGATAAGWLWRRFAGPRPPTGDRPAIAALARHYAPHALFLAAGALGVLLAVERSRALREFRWVVAEPLLFYALVKHQLGQRPTTSDETPPSDSTTDRWSLVFGPSPAFARNLLVAFVLSGALAGLLGLLQYIGLDLAPLLGRKQCFAPDGGPCANIAVDGGLRRVLSVYGHPNNLGLYLGRVWPLAAALALGDQRRTTKDHMWQRLAFGLLSLVCLGGIVVSFSRGAWLGALAAATVLALGMTKDERPRTNERRNLWSLVFGRSSRWLLGLAVALVVLAGLALSLRGDVTAGSTPIRLLLWREALSYIGRHPLGIGLDQFGFYHDPGSGLSLIDPSLIGSSDQYAAHPHNLLLDIWLRLGPLGLIALGWLLLRFVRASARRISSASPGLARPIALGALAAMVAALAHGLVDNFYFIPDLALSFWLLIALAETCGTDLAG